MFLFFGGQGQKICVNKANWESNNTAVVIVKDEGGNVSLDEWFLTLLWVIAPSSSRIKPSKKISSLCIIPEDKDNMVLWNAGNHSSFQQQGIKSQKFWILINTIVRNSNLAKVEKFATQKMFQEFILFQVSIYSIRLQWSYPVLCNVIKKNVILIEVIPLSL